MKPFRLPTLTAMQHQELEKLGQTTEDLRVRTRIDMVIFAAQEEMGVSQIAAIVRESESTILRWLKRYAVAGTAGLYDEPRSDC